ncbi:hypothetical protein U9S86_004567 [Salmonella enterica]|nr:hypothetical protein [Salmonella enterica]EHA9546182.1 hypothetical protein [Salmonella enterica subsp. enterica serovar Braenderup]EIM2420684.1 hypothetical protein [Salmonella enterica]ELT1143539.1 hypothetical protein [Salmonella enterica]ELT1505906.1 hypothetical protein [Salmonella enterica]
MSKQELFDAATMIFLRAIFKQLPFEATVNDALVQEAIKNGYDINVINWAWR